ncbi:MAG: chromate efflux transporter [Deltaproteobacteria bacterium]|nr:chromate efflux transporter [Deltaproteobacteria bacterium]
MADKSQAPHAGEVRATSLKELALLFFRLGTTAFGGPAAHIAMMEDEVVRRRSWLTHQQFLDLLGVTNLIPGPNSTEMAIHIGYQQKGWAGLLVAGNCFILPATLLVALLAWAYVRFGTLPEVAGLLYGLKPVVIAVVLQALWGFALVALKTRGLIVTGLVAAALNVLGVHELVVLLGSGCAVPLYRWGIRQRQQLSALSLTVGATAPIAAFTPVATTVTTSALVPLGLWKLFLFFLKVGSVLFGSGYVLLAFLRADLVERWRWLTEGQLLDAIAVGQVTPGPVFTTATFIGYLLAGPVGAVVATVGIFLPAFFFVAISGPLVRRLRHSPMAGAFLDGVNVASLALMVVVSWQLGREAVVDFTTAALGIISLILLIRFRLNSAWLVLGGGLVGLGLSAWVQ